MRRSIVIGQQIVHQLFTGKPMVGGVIGVLPNGELEQYADVEDAAKRCAALEVTTAIPEEEGWEGMQEMPNLMKRKFERLLAEARGKK